MKRIWGHVVSLFVVGMAVGAVAPACASNNQSIFIRSVLAPSINRQAAGCIYTNDPTQAGLFEGHLDIGVTDSYLAVLLVGNQLTPRGDPQSNRAESNRVQINGAVVRVTEPGGALIREFTSLATGFADPGLNNQPSYATVGVVALDAPTKAMLISALPNRTLTKTVVANIKAFGTTLGGEDLETGEYQLPLEVCNGCLVDFSLGNDDTAKTQPNCLKPIGGTASTATTGPCFVGQDERVNCQLCVSTREACDPTKLNP